VHQKVNKQELSTEEKSKGDAMPSASKKKKKKKKKKNIQKSDSQEVLLKSKQQNLSTPNGKTSMPKKKKNKQKNERPNTMEKSNNKSEEFSQISDSRLKAYGINPKKFKNKIKYGKKST
jgi:protein KRI1